MEPNQRPSLANVWPLIAIVLMVSGILVRTVPLESKRPVDPNRVKFYHAGRQDVEARLWQDPFVAIQHVTPRGPLPRCKEACDDLAHHPSTLRQSIAYKSSRSWVTLFPVMVAGGPYFEDGEGRRRTRYAVVTALLNSGWRPSDEDKLGYVWTFESCVAHHWERRAPELLPYEWFIRENPPGQELLVLWVDEDAITRRPLAGIERIIERLAQKDTPCASPGRESTPLMGDGDNIELLNKPNTLYKKSTELPWWQTQGYPWDAKNIQDNLNPFEDQIQGRSPLPGCCDIRVIGPSTSSSLEGLARELARPIAQRRATTTSNGVPPTMPGGQSATTLPWLPFYSSGATAPIDLKGLLDDVWSNYDHNINRRVTESDLQELRESFKERIIRLTTTDDKLVKALMKELKRRLADATPFSRIPLLHLHSGPLCGDTVVVVSERDTSYARDFHKSFEPYFQVENPKVKKLWDCPEESRPRLHAVHYLRGLDGALPEGTGASLRAASQPSEQARTNTEVVFEQTPLERADGQGQYDYLRRLAAYLVHLDRREKQDGRNGVRAVGVLGNDVYDKVLILDALRDRFPKAVFFASDLDARLLGREVIRSTRNLIVASAYGLTLNSGIQGAAPPFRDTYQSGMYLSTLVALDPDLQHLATTDFSPWFEAPQLFEIGRTRAVPISKGAEGDCKGLNPKSCKNIHAVDEWAGFSFWPNDPRRITLLIVAATGVLGLLFLSRHPYRVVITGMVVVVVMVIIGILVGWRIWPDIISGTGEPFAWFEGISIWPTKGLELLTLLVTFVLLWYGRRQLNRNINSVADEFSLTRLSERKSASMRRVTGKRGFWSCIRGCWGLDQTALDSSGIGTARGPWLDFLDQMQFWPILCRVSMMTALFFVFGIALLNLDWPLSPHRGELSAWFNHALSLILLVFMMALLCTVLDASERTSHYFTHLSPHTLPAPRGEEPTGQGVWTQYPVGEDTMRMWTRFRFAVSLASSVNWFIYLPFIPLLLVLPTRSRVLEAWNFPLPYVALLSIAVLLAVRGAFSLRRAATDLKTKILKELDSQMEALKLAQYSQSRKTDATRALVANTERRDIPSGQAISDTRANAVSAGQENEGASAPDDISPQTRAELLRQIIDEIRSVQEGPFRPFTQEPVVRAILIVSGWVGGLSTVEFLFLR